MVTQLVFLLTFVFKLRFVFEFLFILQSPFGLIEIEQGTKHALQDTQPLYLIEPVQKEYDGLPGAAAIEYRSRPLHDTIIELDTLQPGTWIFSSFPIDSAVQDISQMVVTFVVVRTGNEYLDYLSELHNVPFTLPPRRLKNGHQTDLRIGTDCAELAIYGMRRLGHDIPYCGPKNIHKYCTKVDSIQPGDLIHFGDQVSVIYEDNGIKGVFDEKDQLIHARPKGVTIERWIDSEYEGRSYFKLLRWKSSPIDR